MQYNFPKMRGGGQRPFGFFSKNHLIWKRDPSLMVIMMVHQGRNIWSKGSSVRRYSFPALYNVMTEFKISHNHKFEVKLQYSKEKLMTLMAEMEDKGISFIRRISLQSRITMWKISRLWRGPLSWLIQSPRNYPIFLACIAPPPKQLLTLFIY